MNQVAAPRLRKVVKMGSTLYVCIPHKFAEKHNIKPGDKIVVIANDVMRVVPIKSELAAGKV